MLSPGCRSRTRWVQGDRPHVKAVCSHGRPRKQHREWYALTGWHLHAASLFCKWLLAAETACLVHHHNFNLLLRSSLTDLNAVGKSQSAVSHVSPCLASEGHSSA